MKIVMKSLLALSPAIILGNRYRAGLVSYLEVVDTANAPGNYCALWVCVASTFFDTGTEFGFEDLPFFGSKAPEASSLSSFGGTFEGLITCQYVSNQSRRVRGFLIGDGKMNRGTIAA